MQSVYNLCLPAVVRRACNISGGLTKLRPHDLDVNLSELARDLTGDSGGYEYELWEGPDVLEDIKAGRLVLSQLLCRREAAELKTLISGLIGLFITRHFGDESAYQQLNVVEKFTFPKRFEVPQSVVKSLSKKYDSGHLIRAWAIRRLMYELADLVELAHPEAEDPSASVVTISPSANKRHRLYPLVMRYCKPRTKLQPLAIRIYLELIQGENEGGQIDERSLRRDLRRLRTWEDADPVHTRLKKEYAAAASSYHWKARIPIRLYSESFRPATPAEIIESELLSSLRGDDDTIKE